MLVSIRGIGNFYLHPALVAAARAIRAGSSGGFRPEGASDTLGVREGATLARRDVGVEVMGCAEIRIAARAVRDAPFALVDSTHELARATVAYAAERGWGRAV